MFRDVGSSAIKLCRVYVLWDLWSHVKAVVVLCFGSSAHGFALLRLGSLRVEGVSQKAQWSQGLANLEGAASLWGQRVKE